MFSSFGSTQNQPTAGGAFGNTGQQPQQPQQQQQQQPQQPQQQQGGGLFGSTAGTSMTGGASSLFGNTNTNTSAGQQAPAAGGGLLGGNMGNTQAGGSTGGGLFGGVGTQGGGGLFGGGNTGGAQPASGGLFGGQSAQATGTSAGGSLFGNASGSTTGSAGGGLYGNAAGSGNTGTTSGGGLFGSNTAANTAQPSGGSFGATPGGGSGLFGNTTGTAAAPSAGLFGSTNTNTTGTGGGLFGNMNAPAPATTGSGPFGSIATAQTSAPNLFGNQPQAGPSNNGSLGGSALGQPMQQRPPSLFGGSTLGGSTLLGGTPGSLYASRAVVPAGPSQADAHSQFVSLQQRIEGIYNAWNPASPQCRFQRYFYNLVDPSQVHMYARPTNATNDALWQKAVRENPDPTCLVPVIANGFDDLQRRVEAQTQQAAVHQEKLKELRTRIQALAQRHELSNTSRLHRAAALQTQLTHRVLRVVQHLHLLIPAVRSSAIRPEEEALRAALEDIDQEIRRPGGTGRMRGKLNELWALIGAVAAARERDRKSGGVEWAVVDEDGLQQIAQILAEEQAGLAHLTKILQRNLKDLGVIQGTAVKEEEPDLLITSTSTLRGSVVY